MGENISKIIDRQKFKLTEPEAANIQFHCNVLKDFAHISFDDGLRLQKNVSIIKNLAEKLIPESELIKERQEALNKARIAWQKKDTDINKRSASGEDGKTILPDREKLNAEMEKLNNDQELLNKKVNDGHKKKYEILLNVLPKSAFPKGRGDYDKKTISNGQQSQEVERFSSFLELVGTVITDPDEEA